jgi:NAD+ synthetase
VPKTILAHDVVAFKSMPIPVFRAQPFDPESSAPLAINAPLLAEWLVGFLRDECVRRRGIGKAVLGLSGGVDSAVVAYLCARAFRPENVFAFRMPYKVSSQESFDHAQLVLDDLGIKDRTIDITAMVDGYAATHEPEITPARIGNICARCRTVILFDQSMKLGALPIGTGNKTERLFGYFTWHADDAPPINPLGDLFKTQVWELARELGVPDVIVDKPPTADLIKGQTDEGDFGISFAKADRILYYLVQGYVPEKLVEMGFPHSEVALVYKRVDSTHWKRHMPTVAMVSSTAINEYYLRPVDY